MFCPKCGNAEQWPDTYCRRCGVFLPDLSKPVNTEAPPEQHLKANLVLSVLTIGASFTMAILLYSILAFRSNTHPLIYIAASMFLAIGGWHIQTLIRTIKLKKQIKRRAPDARAAAPAAVEARTTSKLLDPADPSAAVPASVTEDTTRHLGEKVPR